jgi:hypothetical protein
MVSGNRSISSDFIFGLIIAVFVISVIITIMIFFPEGSWKPPTENQINFVTEGRIIRIESTLISVETSDGIINATCGLCFSTTGSIGTTGLCKIDNVVEVRYQKNIIGEYFCINALVE